VEHGISVSTRGLKLSLVLAMLLSMTPAWAADAVVLVTSSDSPITEVSSLDTRKAYLGISVTIAGGTVRPVRQRDDSRLNLIFLQSVIAMSQRSYERRLLSMMLKYGTPRPTEVRDREALIKVLEGNPHAIGYMWASDAESDRRVRKVKVLWQEH
jgi:hypothetical protein